MGLSLLVDNDILDVGAKEMEELSRGLKGTLAVGTTVLAGGRSASKYEGLLRNVCRLNGEIGSSVPADEAAEVDIVLQTSRSGERPLQGTRRCSLDRWGARRATKSQRSTPWARCSRGLVGGVHSMLRDADDGVGGKRRLP